MILYGSSEDRCLCQPQQHKAALTAFKNHSKTVVIYQKKIGFKWLNLKKMSDSLTDVAG